ncbi:16651_t:CDS:2, partial [Racocetra fulgida]
IDKLYAEGNVEELEKRLRNRISFGTAGVSDAINNNLEPWIWDPNVVNNSELCIDNIKEISDAYFEELKVEDNAASNLKFVYTAMHGVGTPAAKRIFEIFGLKSLILTKEQTDPDPDFPTVTFPNPEEGKAEEAGAHVIFANDPDADRFSVSEKQKNKTVTNFLQYDNSGEWTIFSGNQIGVMLASVVLSNYKASGKPLGKLAMLSTAVSSKMLARIAKTEGFYFEETLTGFKWLGNVAIDLIKNGYEVLFAYEEAIGFMIGDAVKDKDEPKIKYYFELSGNDKEQVTKELSNIVKGVADELLEPEKYGLG